MTGLRHCRAQCGHRRQLTPWLGRNQQTADLALDFVVAPFCDPSAHQSSSIVEQVFRWPRVVPERTPYGEVIVDGDWVHQSVVTNSSVDVVDVFAKLKQIGRASCRERV